MGLRCLGVGVGVGVGHTFLAWDCASKPELIRWGEGCLRRDEITLAAKRATFSNKLQCLVCNSTDLISETAGLLGGKGLGATFFWDGESFVYSLRGEGARKMAESFGGGGHDLAAGFKSERILE